MLDRIHCKCKCTRNWPLPIGAFQDHCEQILINKHILVKNPNQREADQLAIYKRRREVELGATKNNISQRSERDLNPRPTNFKSGALTTRPRCIIPEQYMTRSDNGYLREQCQTDHCIFQKSLDAILSVSVIRINMVSQAAESSRSELMRKITILRALRFQRSSGGPTRSRAEHHNYRNRTTYMRTRRRRTAWRGHTLANTKLTALAYIRYSQGQLTYVKTRYHLTISQDQVQSSSMSHIFEQIEVSCCLNR